MQAFLFCLLLIPYGIVLLFIIIIAIPALDSNKHIVNYYMSKLPDSYRDSAYLSIVGSFCDSEYFL